MKDYQEPIRKKKLRKIAKKIRKRKMTTWWAELGIMLVFTIIFTTVIGLYLSFEKIYKQPETKIKIISYLDFSEEYFKIK